MFVEVRLVPLAFVNPRSVAKRFVDEAFVMVVFPRFVAPDA